MAAGTIFWGSGSALATVALKDTLAAEGIAGAVRYYGCPAEESGSGKTFMARAGLFDDLDAAICWHPSIVNGVQTTSFLACIQACFRFTGCASDAAVSPHLGRSALDAVELMNVGVNYMREHMPSDARVHYAHYQHGRRCAERGAGLCGITLPSALAAFAGRRSACLSA
ncbi:hypothetical protein [Mesorhizobium sp.]|uniref:hypothetical protein n=1 Tax=Mesorhizobium sp. TaxID=1871066 RepID=UPI0025DD3BC8|nr:hypothetical protein [Mesorhizobium sp.]